MSADRTEWNKRYVERMIQEEIKKVLQQGESETVEFKSSFNTQSIETLVAFANLKGGAIYYCWAFEVCF